MELQGKSIAFLGDSITEGVGASAEKYIYHQVLKERSGLLNAYNFGISGTRFARQRVASENPRFDLDFISRVDELPAEVDAVIVFGGTNDFGHGDAPFGEMNDRTEWTFYGACHILMQKLINKYPDKPIVFMTPLHRQTEDYNASWKGPKNITLRDYVHAIKEVAESYSIPVLDLYAMSGMQPQLEVQNKLYFADGLHPNDRGYLQIAEKLESFLKAL